MVVGRLAPTPSGYLHLGNICAFAAAWLSVRSQNGRLLLRIEDVDRQRSRPEVEQAIRDDLLWLGFDWDEEVKKQSERNYVDAIKALCSSTYYCECTRAQLRPFKGVYPGTCRDKQLDHGALRFRLPEGELTFKDTVFGTRIEDPNRCGDPVLWRRDHVASYNLAVVADDIRDSVTEVIRGADLLEYSAVQIRLFEALGKMPPRYLHTPLILGPDGKKLSKSHASQHIGAMRDCGASPREIWHRVLRWLGQPPADSLQEAKKQFSPAAIPRETFTALE